MKKIVSMFFIVPMMALADINVGMISIYQSELDNQNQETQLIVPNLSYSNDWLTISPVSGEIKYPFPPFLKAAINIDWMDTYYEGFKLDNIKIDSNFFVMIPLGTRAIALKPETKISLKDFENYESSLTITSRIPINDNIFIVPELGYAFESQKRFNDKYIHDNKKSSWEPKAGLTTIAKLNEHWSTVLSVSYNQKKEFENKDYWQSVLIVSYKF